MLVLEYADSGTLRSYFRKNFKYLTWNDKINLALQIISAIKHIHAENIIHCDLHSLNILVHQKCIKLTDFGLSKRQDEAATSSRKFGGIVPYMDPRSFARQRNNQTFKFDKNLMYIVLVFLCGKYPPFNDNVESHQLAPLIVDISNGARESPVEGTPPTYVQIYTDCWQHGPELRPEIQKVFLELEYLNTNNEQVTNDNKNENPNASLGQQIYQNSSELNMLNSEEQTANENENAYTLMGQQNYQSNSESNMHISDFTNTNLVYEDEMDKYKEILIIANY
ncbi:kinase-like domain-containing protein [Gigaspora margarita]|uniref:Kinase-like domain-containing protein n=1 Tax=Gigaspora margarita TaxID=4874 RepID=A0A8H4EU98_GIGMA|nr:kinase-like domain-containing protein [Gigaspora margarita]